MDEHFNPGEFGFYQIPVYDSDTTSSQSSSPPSFGSFELPFPDLDRSFDLTEVLSPSSEDKAELQAYLNEPAQGNSGRCKKYRKAKKDEKKKHGEILAELKEKNCSLRTQKEDMEKRLHRAKEIYQDCILSGKIKFSM